MMNAKYVVIGGGIAGVSCVSELRRRLSDDDDDDGGGDEKIILVTFSQILKTVRENKNKLREVVCVYGCNSVKMSSVLRNDSGHRQC